VTDPVCGMEVEEADAAAAWEHAGQVYRFCSVGCMERFREDPDRFVGPGDGPVDAERAR
jgi:Cu+-exporting ATPase